MTNIRRYFVKHLITFSLQQGDVETVEEAQSALVHLARNNKLWGQQMLLDVGQDAVYLRDIQTKEELDKYSFGSIFRCESVRSEELFPSLLLLVCQSASEKKPDILFFNCDNAKAEEMCANITQAVSKSSSRKNAPEPIRLPRDAADMIDPYGIPSPPVAHAPNAPPVNPPPYPGPRGKKVILFMSFFFFFWRLSSLSPSLATANGGPDTSLLRAEREVSILNHCFDDIESFMSKLQQTAEAAIVLNQRKKKKKSKKQSAEEDLLTVRARPPPEEEFVDIFQKFKYCFSLLARLKSTIASPSSDELVHHVFKPLDMMVKTTGGPALAASVASPALTDAAVSLLQENLSVDERQLWTSLGPNWTHARAELRGPIAPYTPVFLDGWKPDGFRADGQVWEDPVESQHKHEALRLKQEQQQEQFLNSHIADETDTGGPPEKVYSCSYDFIARNNTELSVQQGETLEVLEASKRWWKCRNRFNQVGFVPFNILEPVAHVESPVAARPPPIPAPPPLAKTFTPAAPSVPPVRQNPPAQRAPHGAPAYNQQAHATEDNDRVMLVNDELLQRLTNGKANNSKPLVIPRSAETSLPLDYQSRPEEVARWLAGKGFSEPTVTCLGVLTGAQLFSLSKDELREVIPEEGARVYSQMAVQRALLEDARRATELEAVMERQKMKVDLKLESSTL
ncbi:epidermal growth factor receptor kinase substrate 8-like protein 1 isoform X2 [Syngnathoides biaculeatus]|uniref:epidermal growth factor receptor kinase substrate 8-like protein 1 isoform X2 n=1 Tax=Syngnathoides biaculeatus TaxID=300417 RepID=UPI002ADD5AE6|nr:epidermal growth factor receptor kinase substrate 8-like protein 1 isoform X2 [Syngnathoides biaculeatus]